MNEANFTEAKSVIVSIVLRYNRNVTPSCLRVLYQTAMHLARCFASREM